MVTEEALDELLRWVTPSGSTHYSTQYSDDDAIEHTNGTSSLPDQMRNERSVRGAHSQSHPPMHRQSNDNMPRRYPHSYRGTDQTKLNSRARTVGPPDHHAPEHQRGNYHQHRSADSYNSPNHPPPPKHRRPFHNRHQPTPGLNLPMASHHPHVYNTPTHHPYYSHPNPNQHHPPSDHSQYDHSQYVHSQYDHSQYNHSRPRSNQHVHRQPGVYQALYHTDPTLPYVPSPRDLSDLHNIPQGRQEYNADIDRWTQLHVGHSTTDQIDHAHTGEDITLSDSNNETMSEGLYVCCYADRTDCKRPNHTTTECCISLSDNPGLYCTQHIYKDRKSYLPHKNTNPVYR